MHDTTWQSLSTSRDAQEAGVGEGRGPAISVAKRTQRVQWMQRVITVLTSGPRFLSFTERFISVKRPRSLPNWNDCAPQRHTVWP